MADSIREAIEKAQARRAELVAELAAIDADLALVRLEHEEPFLASVSKAGELRRLLGGTSRPLHLNEIRQAIPNFTSLPYALNRLRLKKEIVRVGAGLWQATPLLRNAEQPEDGEA